MYCKWCCQKYLCNKGGRIKSVCQVFLSVLLLFEIFMLTFWLFRFPYYLAQSSSWNLVDNNKQIAFYYSFRKTIPPIVRLLSFKRTHQIMVYNELFSDLSENKYKMHQIAVWYSIHLTISLAARERIWNKTFEINKFDWYRNEKVCMTTKLKIFLIYEIVLIYHTCYNIFIS